MSTAVLWIKPVIIILMAGAAVAAYRVSRPAALELSGEIREYRFKLALLAPIGLYAADRIGCPVIYGPSEFQTKNHLMELYNIRHIGTYVRIHQAQKWVLGAAGLLAPVFITVMGSEPVGHIFVISLPVLLYIWPDQELARRVKEKRKGILLDLPEFINTLALMINAGLPFSAALQKAVRFGGDDGGLYKELNLALAETGTGKSLSQALENVAHRCRLPEVTRFVTVVLQNINRGGTELVGALQIMSREAWQTRRDLARKLGEEASSKLVFPMVMVFVAVAIIVLAPAVITMGIR